MNRSIVISLGVALGVALSAVLAPAPAHAFCGFYISGADSKMYNNATVVALMREGTRTVLSMRNNYQGPPKQFAMVIPVPVVLQKDNVKTLSSGLFDRLDQLAAPRLVEYWEQNPCPKRSRYRTVKSAPMASRSRSAGGGGSAPMRPPVVKVEARFEVGEYQVVILSATDALGLEDWIRGNGYQIPPGAAAYLRPYVQSGSKFFVAKVDPKKVTFKRGMAMLSPLRFHYDSQDFSLPIRLGLINSKGTQDLIVHILARGKRYEVANYDNVAIPTNLIVKNRVRKRFAEFYAALLDDTLKRHPNAVVTEYAWDASSCDPCPEPPLTMNELATLGADVIDNKPLMERRPVATIRHVSLSGSNGRAARYVHRHERLFSRCYARARQRDPRLSGLVNIRWRVDSRGRAKLIDMTGNTTPVFETCMTRSFQRIRLPRMASSGTGKLMLKLHLRQMPRQIPRGFVLTRLHARYTRNAIGEDLIFAEAPGLNGGTGGAEPRTREAVESSRSAFQGRYIIRHRWRGKIACKDPQRGMWGGPPREVDSDEKVMAVRNTAFARRGRVRLKSLIRGTIPEQTAHRPPMPAAQIPTAPPAPQPPSPLDEPASEPAPPTPQPAPTEVAQAQPAAGEVAQAQPAAGEPTGGPAPVTPATVPHKADRGCGCQTGPGAVDSAWLLLLAALLLWRRRQVAS